MRRALDRGLKVSAAACAVAACALLVGIVAVILVRGLPSLGGEFVTAAAGERIGSGGVRYQLLGTLLLVTTALAVAAPLALGWSLIETLWVGARTGRTMKRILYAVHAVPSILFGILGLIVFVKFFGWGKSWLGGGIVLGWMIVPTIAVALVERIEALPTRYLSAASALGLSRAQVATTVVLPQCWAGGASGALLGLARAAGETAPILFTAAVFSGVTLPRGVVESPVLALPYHVFTLAQDSFDPAASSHLWAAAFVLLALVLGLSLAALPLRLRAAEEARHG